MSTSPSQQATNNNLNLDQLRTAIDAICAQTATRTPKRENSTEVRTTQTAARSIQQSSSALSSRRHNFSTTARVTALKNTELHDLIIKNNYINDYTQQHFNLELIEKHLVAKMDPNVQNASG